MSKKIPFIDAKIAISKNFYTKNVNKKFITTAFQRRFRQNLVNGIPDQECFLISKNLLKS